MCLFLCHLRAPAFFCCCRQLAKLKLENLQNNRCVDVSSVGATTAFIARAEREKMSRKCSVIWKGRDRALRNGIRKTFGI